MYNFIINNARICSGLNEPSYTASVGIKDKQIVVLGAQEDKENAQCIIDAAGLILTPGFIDPHASTGFGYFFPEAANHKLYQGITTEIFGNCGTSPAPVGKHLVSTLQRLSSEIGFPFNWRSLSEYFSEIKDKLQFYIGTVGGNSTLRVGNMEEWKTLLPQQLTEMKKALKEAMDEGALGFSTGLIYAPGCFANLEEIVTLAKISAAKGGMYASHIRDERNEVETAIEEALTISKQANIRTLISHLKAAEKQNWGKIPVILKQLETFNQENPTIQAAIDVYPYTAISTKLRAFIPKYILEDGIGNIPEKLKEQTTIDDIQGLINERDYDLDQMTIISDESPDYFGKTVAQIAQEQQLTKAETIAQILTFSTETWIVYHCIDQKDIDTAILWDKAMICTDSWSYPINAPHSIGQPHPRSYGAFTEYLERYVIKLKALSWEEAIHKITYLPAQFFKLHKRGQIKTGFFADLVLIDPNLLKAKATYTTPRKLSEGVEYLWVNGQLVINKKEICNSTAGEILTLNCSL